MTHGNGKLRDLSLKAVYRSASSNLLQEFYIPCLSRAIRYDRAVGFFSATMLSYAAQGLSAFSKNSGYMRLIVGSALELEEEGAVLRGQNFRALVSGTFFLNQLTERLLSNISQELSELSSKRLALLEALIADRVLDIKIAVRRRGMFHEKIGIMYDSHNDYVVFQGSANETSFALAPDFNFESVNIFKSWRNGDNDHAAPHIEFFEELWNNNIQETSVVSLPDPVMELLRARNRRSEAFVPISQVEEIQLSNFETVRIDKPKIPNGFNLMQHQRLALQAWQQADFSGILSMATGTGKTSTAIYASSKIFDDSGRLFLIVAVPFKNLAEQWTKNLAEFDISAIECFDTKKDWTERLSRCVYEYKQGFQNFIAVVVVNRTLQSPEFQKQLKKLAKDPHMLFVGDECHNHGTPQMLRALPVDPGMRLGLSATYERHGDEEGTRGLKNYYSGVVYTFTIHDAMNAEPPILCPYRYFVHFVDFTPEEASAYSELSIKIVKWFAKKGAGIEEKGPSHGSITDLLLFKRARLLGSARNKLEKLRALVQMEDPGPFTLVYCGDGRVETDLDADEDNSDSDIRHIDAVVKILGDLGKRVGTYTYRESTADHRELLNAFRLGKIEMIAAIRCLDEGIDLPACRTAFILASSRNPRQFIQRRGRVLRRSPGKEHAIIHDFVVRIPQTNEKTEKLERSLLMSELQRIKEFAQDAQNSADVLNVIAPILDEYSLFGEFLNSDKSKSDETL